jgi:RNA polymerase sigma factor (sigma-70 family)
MMPRAMDLHSQLARAAEGDVAAREAIASRFYPRVRELVHAELQHDFRKNHRWIVAAFSTGDVVQEVFVGVLAGLTTFEGDDDAAFTRFLATLVKHRLVDAVRHHEAARRDARKVVEAGTASTGPQGVAAGATPSVAAAVGEQLAAFRAALAEFPECERVLLELRLVDEAPWQDVAARLGYPSADAARKAFRGVQSRLLVKLRRRGVRPPGETTT